MLVHSNGNQEITAQMVNNALNEMITSMGEQGYQFIGVDTPSTDPGVPDGQVFYIATEVGDYTHFIYGGGTNYLSVASGEVAIFKFNGTSWSKELTGIASNEKLSELDKQINGSTTREIILEKSGDGTDQYIAVSTLGITPPNYQYFNVVNQASNFGQYGLGTSTNGTSYSYNSVEWIDETEGLGRIGLVTGVTHLVITSATETGVEIYFLSEEITTQGLSGAVESMDGII